MRTRRAAPGAPGLARKVRRESVDGGSVRCVGGGGDGGDGGGGGDDGRGGGGAGC